MRPYSVVLPVAGSIRVSVYAANENEAIEKAMDEWPFTTESTTFKFDKSSHNILAAELIGLEAYEKIVDGNVCCVECVEACAEEEEEEI